MLINITYIDINSYTYALFWHFFLRYVFNLLFCKFLLNIWIRIKIRALNEELIHLIE